MSAVFRVAICSMAMHLQSNRTEIKPKEQSFKTSDELQAKLKRARLALSGGQNR